MCGIFSYRGTKHITEYLMDSINKISYRGPDNSQLMEINNNTLFAFHRLSIMGLNSTSNQPLKLNNNDSLTLICNGEIYNYKDLAKKYNFILSTQSDCEIILHLFNSFGIKKTINELDGVFMFVIHDNNTNNLYAGRDPFGVRPGFIGYSYDEIFIASEAKSIVDFCKKVEPFPPGSYWDSESDNFFSYFSIIRPQINRTKKEIYEEVNNLLVKSVRKRLMSDREIGCLLSGGLDSSLIAGLACREYKDFSINTFSIGMKGSIDLKYADRVSKHIKSNHHSIEIDEEDFLNAIDDVIYKIESYDITTIRASVGNYLVSKYIRQNSSCKVIFNGDGADEVCCGYFYLKNAPILKDLEEENIRLLNEIHLFDVLRSDRSISSNGLEPRTPFLDKEFVKYYLSIPIQMKKFDGKDVIEKYVLRKAFEKENILPEDVLWRNKCAFSDGVSNKDKSWHNILKNYFNKIVSDKDFNNSISKYSVCPPISKESYYYRKTFEKYFGSQSLIPHYWMPKWQDTNDPSARELDGYKE